MNRVPPTLLAVLFLAACVPATPPPPPPAHTTVSQCLARFEMLDAEVTAHGGTPSSPRRIPGFPYLRADRFLASFREEPLTEEQFATWWRQLAAADREARRIEQASLPADRVYADRLSGSIYEWRDYATLYATPDAGGERGSLFGSDGIIAGTERAERNLLWLTGVLEPGAMRERGRHAIAFLGRRHFDDADLLDRFFQPVE